VAQPNLAPGDSSAPRPSEAAVQPCSMPRADSPSIVWVQRRRELTAHAGARHPTRERGVRPRRSGWGPSGLQLCRNLGRLFSPPHRPLVRPRGCTTCALAHGPAGRRCRCGTCPRGRTAPQHHRPQHAPAANRFPAFAPTPAHRRRARPGRRRQRTGWRASCGSLGSRRCDVGPRSYSWLVETVTKRNRSPRVPFRTRPASQRTGVLRTYREVVVMLA
jgi:hypothetical protein